LRGKRPIFFKSAREKKVKEGDLGRGAFVGKKGDAAGVEKNKKRQPGGKIDPNIF